MTERPPISAPTVAVPPSSLAALLAVTFVLSMGTGVFWNAISFVARHHYGFDAPRNMVLHAVMGGTYTLAAFAAGRVMRALSPRLSPRSLLIVLVAIQGVLCLGPILSDREVVLWIVGCGVSVASAIVWPIIEAYFGAGRHGAEMRRAIGWFNLVWMTAVAVPLLAMGGLVEHHAQWLIGTQAFVMIVGIAPILRLEARPGDHHEDDARRSVPEEYRRLLRSGRALLPTSYVLLAAMSPILPYRFAAIGAPIALETPTTATWMLVRVLVMLAMWRLGFWHGRWGTLLLGWASMIGGFATVVLAPTMPVMLVGFGFFGAGLGIVYYAALYYGLAVGRAAVEAGGTHEALIGSGYALGPLAGLVGTLRWGPAGIVGCTWAVAAVGTVFAAIPYARARGARAR